MNSLKNAKLEVKSITVFADLNFQVFTAINERIRKRLREVKVFIRQGMSSLDVIKQIGIVEQAYYRWRKQYDKISID